MRFFLAFCTVALTAFPRTAYAAGIDGSSLNWPWALPFAGLLLSIATGPLLFPKIWHSHYGKIAFGWSLLALGPLAAAHGITPAAAALTHAAIAEYLSFVVLLFTLYVIAGGLVLTGTLPCSVRTNVTILAIGTLMASVVGTTGAAMILIRPLLRANAARKNAVHVVIFFIVLVANVGGALTPLGDPPLFVGFLRGVSFFWTAQHLWPQTLIVAALVLAMFAVVDLRAFRREPSAAKQTSHKPLRLRGKINILLFGIAIAAILTSAVWKPGIAFNLLGTAVEIQNLTRDTVLVLCALVSLRLTAAEHRDANAFSWEPIREVAILFAGIFAAIVPVMAMLQAGRNGSFAFVLQAVTASDGLPHEAAYFWLTGALSAFLDNAPTYLVFFELAGGSARDLMGPLAGTLSAISMGAVYMGALTYIGNAPNLMVYAIAVERGVRMPSFFGYTLWSAAILIPLFLLLTLLPISPILKLP